MNALAKQLNEDINSVNSNVVEMLSFTGRKLFFPKGILTQSAEAKEKAEDKFNATIGIATEKFKTMYLSAVMKHIEGIAPEDALNYSSSFGIAGLRNRWREEIYRKNPSLEGKEISLPVATTGITHGLSIVGDMFVDPEDVVIFPDKMWGNNNLILSVKKHARISNYTMFTASGGFNIQGFESKIREEARVRAKLVVFLNFPNNPTGYTITRDEADQILAVLKAVAEEGTNIVAVTDDAYFGLYYDGSITESIFADLVDLHPRVLAVKLDGATKEMFVWGLRIGFITFGSSAEGDLAPFYNALERKTAGNIRGTVSNVCHLSQSIVLNTLNSDDFLKEQEEKVAILAKRARRVKEVLADPRYADAWEPYPFNSGYFMCLRLKTVKAEPLRVHLLENYKVGLITVGESDLRVAFSSMEEENIKELFDIILKGVDELDG